MIPSLQCRVIVDSARSGQRNMAIDATLLESGLQGENILRFYEWDVPTVSLGHFQSRQDLTVPPRFAGLPVVPRLSGGGAILHDQELTYSCVLNAHHPLRQDPSGLYDLIHEVIISELEKSNVSARMRGDDAFTDNSFLCFSRGDARDIVIGNHKIVGSAQRRRQGVTLQHGSILLKTSPRAPEFPGIAELTGVELTAASLIPGLTLQITKRLELEGVPGCLSPEELETVEKRLQTAESAPA